MDFLPLLAMLYVIGPVAALVACFACRRPGELLAWGGGLVVLTIGIVAVIWVTSAPQFPADCPIHFTVAMGMVMLLAFPFAASGAVMLIGGLVRWCVGSWRGRRDRGRDADDGTGHQPADEYSTP